MLRACNHKKAIQNCLLSFIIIIFYLFSITVQGNAETWQNKLEAHFDIVETFDQLQDWYGTGTNVVAAQVDMPKKLDGSSSIWQIYSQYYTGPNQHLDNWIGDHGPDYNWRSHKSATINYPPLYCGINVDDVKGYGPERLGAYIGDGTPQSGYHSIYVFFMMKFHDGFWALADGTADEFKYPPVVKMFDAVTGFTDAMNYAEHACQSNIQHEYGTNFSIYNAGGGGLSRPKKLYFLDSSNITSWDSAGSCWRYAYERKVQMHEETRFDAQYLNNTWIGIEYHLDLGTLGNHDGRSQFWVYDEEGNQIGFYDSGPVRMQTEFAYNYNKFVFGGNYQCVSGTECPGETRWYFDDFIVDDQRIGPAYFSLLNKISYTLSVTLNEPWGEISGPITCTSGTCSKTLSAGNYILTVTADDGYSASLTGCDTVRTINNRTKECDVFLAGDDGNIQITFEQNKPFPFYMLFHGRIKDVTH